jgi:decaprenylphospho-beta-D-ribofuranose 2-oxidase
MKTESHADAAPHAVPRFSRMTLSGWGRYPHCLSEVYRPEKIAELAEIVAADAGQLVARGAGRAYGDAAINGPGRVIDFTRFDRMLNFDAQSGRLRCEAGVTIGDLIDTFLPRGFFPPVVPGTRFVTLGGALAADVHGKNHHRDSSFAAHVTNFDLMVASGQVLRCSREENADLFAATAGGMGLTGIVLEVELTLRRVESAWLAGEVVRAANIDAAMEAFERADREFDYSMAWIDCVSGGSALGRSVITLGNFATREQLGPKQRAAPLRIKPRTGLRVPFDLPAFALNPLTVRTFNAVYYQLHPSTPRTLIDCERFFFPLDSIREWNRMYGADGFVQYQCVFPDKASREGLVAMLDAITQGRRGSFLAVLKKFGPQDGMLSFPMPGYTLTLDFPLHAGLMPILDQLDEIVLRRGGRVYLAKDARMRPEVFRAMYPNLPAWRAIKDKADPHNRFCSSLSRRLAMGIDGPASANG